MIPLRGGKWTDFAYFLVNILPVQVAAVRRYGNLCKSVLFHFLDSELTLFPGTNGFCEPVKIGNVWSAM